MSYIRDNIDNDKKIQKVIGANPNNSTEISENMIHFYANGDTIFRLNLLDGGDYFEITTSVDDGSSWNQVAIFNKDLTTDFKNNISINGDIIENGTNLSNKYMLRNSVNLHTAQNDSDYTVTLPNETANDTESYYRSSQMFTYTPIRTDSKIIVIIENNYKITTPNDVSDLHIGSAICNCDSNGDFKSFINATDAVEDAYMPGGFENGTEWAETYYGKESYSGQSVRDTDGKIRVAVFSTNTGSGQDISMKSGYTRITLMEF